MTNVDNAHTSELRTYFSFYNEYPLDEGCLLPIAKPNGETMWCYVVECVWFPLHKKPYLVTCGKVSE